MVLLFEQRKELRRDTVSSVTGNILARNIAWRRQTEQSADLTDCFFQALDRPHHNNGL